MTKKKDSNSSLTKEELQKHLKIKSSALERLKMELKIKTEENKREAQIETALERVRSRSMDMQKSEELAAVIQVLYEQLIQLNFEISNAGFLMGFRETDDFNLWMADSYTTFPIKEHLPYFNHPQMNCFKEAKVKGLTFLTNSLTLEEKNTWFRYCFTILDVPKEAQQQVFDSPGLSTSAVLLNNILVYLLNYAGTPYSDAENATLIRFGKVIEQTYTRFLDLKNAEAQARESQIQLALEQVRARTMAMQKSNELAETASLLFKQLIGLGIKATQLRTCAIVTLKSNEPIGECWITKPDGDIIPRSFIVPYDETSAYKTIYEAWKNGEIFLVVKLSGDAVVLHLNSLKKYAKIPTQQFKALPDQPTETFTHAMFFSQGYLFIISNEPLSEYHEIFKRFGAVFQQTYTRFLDLQKAELQAREAQIEAALERVRSRSMGMRKSGELKEVIQIVYEQFVYLNIQVEHTGFIMDYKERNDMHIWLADNHEVPSEITIPYFDSPHWNSFNQAKEKGIDFFANLLNFEEKNKFYHDLFQLITGVPDETQSYYLSCPALAGSTVLLDNVGLYIENFSGTPYTDEENNTLMRFGKVFQQTYTRFLDLQKAETQAREAQIEASLEKVRSSAMAMHNSSDISLTTNVIFAELHKLTIQSRRCGIVLLEKKSRTGDIYAAATSSDGELHTLKRTVEMTQHPAQLQQYESWLSQETFVSVLSGEELKSYYQLPFFYSSTSYTPPSDYGHKEYGYYIPFSAGLFYVWTEKPYSDDEINVLGRFKSIIDLTFRRYFDLQKAEAQARDAKIEAALERERSRTLAMQSSDELAETASVLFNQLIILQYFGKI
jgi:hypothetical protein